MLGSSEGRGGRPTCMHEDKKLFVLLADGHSSITHAVRHALSFSAELYFPSPANLQYKSPAYPTCDHAAQPHFYQHSRSSCRSQVRHHRPAKLQPRGKRMLPNSSPGPLSPYLDPLLARTPWVPTEGQGSSRHSAEPNGSCTSPCPLQPHPPPYTPGHPSSQTSQPIEGFLGTEASLMSRDTEALSSSAGRCFNYNTVV